MQANPPDFAALAALLQSASQGNHGLGGLSTTVVSATSPAAGSVTQSASSEAPVGAGSLPEHTPILGKVKAWYEVKGYGFLSPEFGGPDVFVHKNQLSATQVLNQGAPVTFEVRYNPQRSKYEATKCDSGDGEMLASGVDEHTLALATNALNGMTSPYAAPEPTAATGGPLIIIPSGVPSSSSAPSPSSRDPSDNLFVAGLPSFTSEDSLREIFGKYGVVKQAKVLPDTPGKVDKAALIRMGDVSQAKWIVDNLNGHTLEGMWAPVSIRFADNRAEKAKALGLPLPSPGESGYRPAATSAASRGERFAPYTDRGGNVVVPPPAAQAAATAALSAAAAEGDGADGAGGLGGLAALAALGGDAFGGGLHGLGTALGTIIAGALASAGSSGDSAMTPEATATASNALLTQLGLTPPSAMPAINAGNTRDGNAVQQMAQQLGAAAAISVALAGLGNSAPTPTPEPVQNTPPSLTSFLEMQGMPNGAGLEATHCMAPPTADLGAPTGYSEEVHTVSNNTGVNGVSAGVGNDPAAAVAAAVAAAASAGADGSCSGGGGEDTASLLSGALAAILGAANSGTLPAA
eukprot:TRINITY_DN37635_c0_g1_i1.p1 TRINITY_DN37635_c0_g1~~TRINITY_DN37635_c0_g1_i1.p1  ORF type:complete len:578 (+),score=121.79 TRINITY_DN37635_c0_g1_i1:68-1801(+)